MLSSFTWHGNLHQIHSDLHAPVCGQHHVIPLMRDVKTPGPIAMWADLEVEKIFNLETNSSHKKVYRYHKKM